MNSSTPGGRGDRSTIAVIGVGRIGLPICRRLIGAGHTVIAVDISPARRELAAEAGAVTGPSASQACERADLVLTVLPGGPELRAEMLGGELPGAEMSGAEVPGADVPGPDVPGAAMDGRGDENPGLLRRMPAGLTWIDLTSAGPELGQDLAEAALAAGVLALDSPVGGGVSAAEQGTLTLFVGGAADLLDRWRPVLEAIAEPDRILHLGRPGAGYLTKLLVNLLWFGQAVATGEAMLLAQAGGLDLGRLRQVLMAGPAGSSFITSYLPALFDGDYLTSFGLDRCVEELQAVRAAAQGYGLPFELSGLVADLHARALAEFGPVDGELMAVAYLEARAGRTIRADP